MALSMYESVFFLLSGSGLFLFGMRSMGIGIEGMAMGKISTLLARLKNNGPACYTLGAGVTSIIQASDATVILSMTFADKNIISTKNAIYISLGARLGTTITGVLVAFSTLSITPIMMSLSLLGVIALMFSKSNKGIGIGQILSGLGVLFVGIYLMGFSISGNSFISSFFSSLFSRIAYPPLLFLLGIVFTSIMQSSSAMSGVLIVLIEAGSLPFSSAIFLIIGATVGTTVVPLFASLPMNGNAKEIAISFSLTALFSAIVLGIAVWLFKKPICTLYEVIGIGAWRVALFNVTYSLIASLLMFPFVPKIQLIAERIFIYWKKKWQIIKRN